MKRVASILALALIAAACNKDSDVNTQVPVATSFEDLSVPTDFNWSSSEKVQILVNLQQSATLPINLEGSFLWIVNANNERIAISKINASNKAQFNVLLPAQAQGYKFYLPATEEKWDLSFEETQTLSLADPMNDPNFKGKARLGKGASTANPPGTNIFGNADFETAITNFNVGFAYNPTTGTLDDGKWIVTDNEWDQNTVGGSTVFQVDDGKWTHLWQLHTVNAGDSIHLTADWNGRVRAFLFFYSDANATSPVSYEYLDLASGNDEINAVVPNGATVVSALFNLFDDAWIDNAFLSNPAAITDTDNDGVADDQDDFPNDPNRAYLSYYPSAGRQTIAFEDMWPVQGDYDFNDMIVSVKADLIKDGNGNWVSAEYQIALDAFGGGIESGLALRLVDANNNTMSDIIASVSGSASEDPDVTNGIIVFSDPDAVRSQYYSNTETGLMSTPDTVTFTINFSSNNGSVFNSDFYIFHRLERGREIHMVGFTGTAAADQSLYNTGDDVNGTYKTVNGLPWAMDLVLDGSNFKHPFEKVDMITAYPQFSAWASSGGSTNPNWYQTPSIGDVVNLLQ